MDSVDQKIATLSKEIIVDSLNNLTKDLSEDKQQREVYRATFAANMLAMVQPHYSPIYGNSAIVVEEE